MNFSQNFHDMTQTSAHTGHSDHLITGNTHHLASAMPDNANWAGFGEQGHGAGTGNSMQYSARNMSGRPDSMVYLAMASKDDLVRANNHAYILLESEKHVLLARLEAQQLLVNDLRSIISSRQSFAQPSQHGLLGLSVPALPTTAPPPSINQEHSSASGSLPATTPPPLCSSIDYPDVPFWEKSSWALYVKKELDRGREAPPKTGFLTDEEGLRIPRDRMSAMTATARSLFVEIFRARCDPETWLVVGKVAGDYFTNCLANEYPEFQWGEGLWKCKAFAVCLYPTWKRDHRDKGKISRHRPSIQQSKRKHDSSSDQKIKKKLKSTVVGTADHGTSSRSRGATKSTLRARLTPRSSSVGSVEFVGDLPEQAIPSSPELEYVSPRASMAPSTGSCNVVPKSRAQIKVPQSDATSTTSSTKISDSGLPPQTSKDKGSEMGSDKGKEHPVLPQATDPASTGRAASDMAHPAVDSPDSTPLAISDPPNTETAPSSTRGLRRRNVLENLSIPKPNVEVPYQPPSAAAIANSKKKMAVVKGIQPTAALTARNLFMIDYLKGKTGPVTTAEFKAVYDAQDADSRKKYDDLSKRRKAEKNASSAGPEITTAAASASPVTAPASSSNTELTTSI